MELSTASNVCTNELDEEMESVNCVMYVSGLGYEFERVATEANKGLVIMGFLQRSRG